MPHPESCGRGAQARNLEQFYRWLQGGPSCVRGCVRGCVAAAFSAAALAASPAAFAAAFAAATTAAALAASPAAFAAAFSAAALAAFLAASMAALIVGCAFIALSELLISSAVRNAIACSVSLARSSQAGAQTRTSQSVAIQARTSSLPSLAVSITLWMYGFSFCLKSSSTESFQRFVECS